MQGEGDGAYRGRPEGNLVIICTKLQLLQRRILVLIYDRVVSRGGVPLAHAQCASRVVREEHFGDLKV